MQEEQDKGDRGALLSPQPGSRGHQRWRSPSLLLWLCRHSLVAGEGLQPQQPPPPVRGLKVRGMELGSALTSQPRPPSLANSDPREAGTDPRGGGTYPSTH